MHRGRYKLFLSLAVVFGVAAALGVFYGALAWWLLAGALLSLAWLIGSALTFERWLARNGRPPAPELANLWGSMESHVLAMRRRHRLRKQRLRQVTREVRKCTAAMPDGAVVLDARREIVWSNKRAAALLGIGKADRGRRIENFVRAPEFVEYLRRGRYSEGVSIAAPRDPDVQLMLTMVAYGDDQWLLIIRDVSLQKRLERIRSDFVANASHELRSPLTVLHGYLDTMADDPEVTASWGEPVEEMRRQARRMTNIISDLLELSRLEAERSEAERTAVDVPGMLAVINKDAQARERRPAVIAFEVEPGGGLLGNERELHSAFNNIVDNAIKYTPQDGRIDIRWWVDEQGGHFQVADTGLGIDAEEVPRITERFYRVDKGRSRREGGTGLGLSIVKHVLQRHGARLRVDSTPGSGSVFTCHFPADRVHRRAA